MELELTVEEVKQSVSAAYDSVALLAELNAKETLTEEETETVTRNVEHIRIMMAKEWFVGGLTKKQITVLKKI
jgi:hypothetical protein